MRQQHHFSKFASKAAQRTFALLTLVAFCGLLSACSKTPFVWANELPQERKQPSAERVTIRSGDTISLSVVGQSSLSSQHVVAADGTISLPNLGLVSVTNRTAEQARVTLVRELSKILAAPQVSVAIVAQVIEVTVMGEVRSSGKYLVKAGDGVANALAMAGGITEYANEKAIYLVRTTEPLRIRFKMDDLVRGGNSARAFALRDGDLIVVE